MALKEAFILILWSVLVVALVYGLTVGFMRGDMNTILTAMLLLVPTALIGGALIIELLYH